MLQRNRKERRVKVDLDRVVNNVRAPRHYPVTPQGHVNRNEWQSLRRIPARPLFRGRAFFERRAVTS